MGDNDRVCGEPKAVGFDHVERCYDFVIVFEVDVALACFISFVVEVCNIWSIVHDATRGDYGAGRVGNMEGFDVHDLMLVGFDSYVALSDSSDAL